MHFALKTLKSFLIDATSDQSEGSYHFNHWEVQLGSKPAEDMAKMASLHEMYHGQLNDTTAYGTLLHLLSLLHSESNEKGHYRSLLESAIDYTSKTHEVYATYSSMFTVQKGVPCQTLIEPYGNAYMGYFKTGEYFANTMKNPLLGYQLFQSVIRVCMQVSNLDKFANSSPLDWTTDFFSESDIPDNRLSLFEKSSFLDYVKDQLCELIDKETDAACLSALVTSRWDEETYHRLIVSDEADLFYDKIGFMLYDLCRDYIKSKSVACLSFNGHQAFTERLLHTVEQALPTGNCGKVRAPDSESLVAKANILHDFSNERLLISKEKYLSTIHHFDDSHLANIESFFSIDDPHVHIVARPVTKFLEQYSFSQKISVDPAIKTLVAMRTRRKKEDSFIHIVDHYNIDSCQSLQELITEVKSKGAVYVSCALSCTFDKNWQQEWMPILNEASSIFILVDYNPFELINYWFSEQKLQIQYGSVNLQYMDSDYIIFVLKPAVTNSVVYFFPCSAVVSDALITELAQHPESVVETVEHIQNNQALVAVLSHLIKEEPWFDFLSK